MTALWAKAAIRRRGLEWLGAAEDTCYLRRQREGSLYFL